MRLQKYPRARGLLRMVGADRIAVATRRTAWSNPCSTATSSRTRTSATVACSPPPAWTAASTGTSLRRFLDGGDGVDDVRKESEAASRAGISGVPCFIFEGRYAVSGAQPPDVFERVFELTAAAPSETPAAPQPAAT